MTRTEARMIAEEFYKLIKKDVKGFVQDAVVDGQDEYFNTKQAAEYLGVSESHIRHNIDFIPCTKVGGRYRFRKSKLSAYMSRKSPI